MLYHGDASHFLSYVLPKEKTGRSQHNLICKDTLQIKCIINTPRYDPSWYNVVEVYIKLYLQLIYWWSWLTQSHRQEYKDRGASGRAERQTSCKSSSPALLLSRCGTRETEHWFPDTHTHTHILEDMIGMPRNPSFANVNCEITNRWGRLVRKGSTSLRYHRCTEHVLRAGTDTVPIGLELTAIVDPFFPTPPVKITRK